MKCARDSIRRSRSKSLSDWLEQSFYPFDFYGYDRPNIPIDNTKIHIFEEDFEKERRKPLRELTHKGLKHRLQSLLNHIQTIAENENENENPKTIAAYALQCFSKKVMILKAQKSVKKLLKLFPSPQPIVSQLKNVPTLLIP